jgi:adenylylsulfate kinase
MSSTIWLTGLSASGKSTLAQALKDTLSGLDKPCRIIDGDELRRGLCADLGFSRADRRENIRRAAEVCYQLNLADVAVVAALISPYREDREMARQIIGEERFIEVHLDTPLEVCEQRDPRGLYRRARAGEIPTFTGISDPYEAPEAPALRLETHRQEIAECTERLLALLKETP